MIIIVTAIIIIVIKIVIIKKILVTNVVEPLKRDKNKQLALYIFYTVLH